MKKYDYSELIDTGKKLNPPCYQSHPPLAVGAYEINGGSCAYPIENQDIYIGFDYSMRTTAASYPWNASATKEIYFHISDMKAPANPKEFHKMIVWVWEQLQAGKKVHAGCIGGHGRTGTFLAALVAHATGNKDAITYVRENYCDHAVESAEQVEFLVKHYGINKVKGYKEGNKFQGFTGAQAWTQPAKNKIVSAAYEISPVKSDKSIWGKK